MDRTHAERRLTTKNGHWRKCGGDANRRKTKTDDAGLDDDRWIWKAQRKGQQRVEWRRGTFEHASGREEYKRMTKTADAGLDDDRWIWKAQKRDLTASEISTSDLHVWTHWRCLLGRQRNRRSRFELCISRPRIQDIVLYFLQTFTSVNEGH